MQPEWLMRYLHQHAAAHPEPAPGGVVSRRDFVRTGLAAGLTAGMAAGGVAAQVGRAEAQAANPMGKDW